jgi:hypothetical protein
MPRIDKGVKRGPRGPYAKRTDETGKVGRESAAQRSFWKFHKLRDIMVMDPKELEATLDKFFDEYEARNIRNNPRWWYPISNKNSLSKIRNKRTDIDKGWHL